ncbi:MAG: hypothetical protein N6V49_07125, partial [Serratia symbiotica]|nr:hypothetical protein [Serratia symbiotica]
NLHGKIFSNGALSLTAGTLNNQQGQLIAADGRLTSLSGAVGADAGRFHVESRQSRCRSAEPQQRHTGRYG